MEFERRLFRHGVSLSSPVHLPRILSRKTGNKEAWLLNYDAEHEQPEEFVLGVLVLDGQMELFMRPGRHTILHQLSVS